MKAIPLSKFGLLTVAEAAALKGKGVRAVQRWIANGDIPAVPIAVGGGRTLYLVRRADVVAFTPKPPGHPKAE